MELDDILFDACRKRKLEVIIFIAKRHPELIAKKDVHANTALHIACENGMPVDGISCLYSAYPDALAMHNDEGASSFHMVCKHGKSVDNLKFLHDKLPIGLVTANKDGDLPTHWINEDASEELIKYLLVVSPKICAETKNNDNELPIHIACKKGLSLNIIRLLLKAYPSGILQRDKDGMIPIHDACRCSRVDSNSNGDGDGDGSNNKLELVKFFHEISPTLFKKSDNKGNLSLHHAINSTPDVVQYVIKANKSALHTTNNYGFLPIHKACSLCVDVSIIKILVDNYPNGVKAKTLKGLYPFHLGITSLPILDYLYDLFDDAAKIPDKKGRYPIHIACKKGAPLDVITFLVEKYPIATWTIDDSKMLPLHHAIINNSPFTAIKFLIEFYPEALKCVDGNNRLPFHLVFLHCNNLEVFEYLRNNYGEECQDIMVRPSISSWGSSSSSSSFPLTSQLLQNRASNAEVKNDRALQSGGVNSSKEKSQSEDEEDSQTKKGLECAATSKEKSIIQRTPVKEETEPRKPTDNSELNCININHLDSCSPSMDIADEDRVMESSETIENSSNQCDQEESRTKIDDSLEEIKQGESNYSNTNVVSLHKRRRLDLKHDLTTASTFTAASDSGIKRPHNKNDNTIIDANIERSWTKVEKETYLSVLRDFGKSNNRKESVFKCISAKVKTRNHAQCYDYAYRIRLKIERNKNMHITSDERSIYNLLKSCNNKNNLFSFKIGKIRPSNNNANADATKATTPTNASTNATTSTLSKPRHSLISSPATPSESLSSTPAKSAENRRKGSWTKGEIEAFLLSLHALNNGRTITIERKDLFEYIANKVRTKNYKQCYDFPRNVKCRVEVSHTATHEEHIIHDIFQKYNKTKVIDIKPTNSTTKTSNDNDSNSSSSSNSSVSSYDSDNSNDDTTNKNKTASIVSKSSLNLTLPSLPHTSEKAPTKNAFNKGLWLQDEIELLISGIRKYSNSTNNNQCVYKIMSQTVKTRNVRSCYDFVRRAKSKIDNGKTHTSADYTVYNLLANCVKDDDNDNNFDFNSEYSTDDDDDDYYV